MGLAKNAQKTEIKNNKLIFGIPKYNFKLLPIVNANNEQLKKWGYYSFKDESGAEVEPKYVRPKTVNGQAMDYNIVQLEFYARLVNAAGEGFPDLANHVFRFSFYIEELDQPMSGSGKFCFVNEIGETQWAVDENSLVENAFCHNTKVFRIAKRGEKDFLESIHEIAGLSNGIVLENIDALLKGDFREIVKLINDINNQKDYQGFKALLAIAISSKGNPYQEFFTRKFDYGAKEKATNIARELKNMQTNQGGQYAYKHFYGNKVTTGLTEYQEGMIKIDKPVDTTSSAPTDELPW